MSGGAGAYVSDPFGPIAGMSPVDPAALKDKGYDGVQKFVDKTLFQSPLSFDLKLKLIAEFEKIKAVY